MTYLNLGSTDPSNSWQIVLHEQMVRLVVKAPLTDNKVGPRVLDPVISALPFSSTQIQTPNSARRTNTHFLIISKNFSFSYSLNFLYSSTLSISSLCFVLGLGGSNGHVKIAIFASRTVLGI